MGAWRSLHPATEGVVPPRARRHHVAAATRFTISANAFHFFRIAGFLANFAGIVRRHARTKPIMQEETIFLLRIASCCRKDV